MLYRNFKKENLKFGDVCDVAIIGAGHAGCEAALACAKLGLDTRLFTITLDAVANMPCNPSIGGTSKGQLVREIDALGGVMGELADLNSIQRRRLNASKGPAVISTRAQIDRQAYRQSMKLCLEKEANLQIFQAEVLDLVLEELEPAGSTGVEDSCESIASHEDQFDQSQLDELNTKTYKIRGLYARGPGYIECKAAILCTGTFLNASVILGEYMYSSGPDGLAPSTELADSLKDWGFLKKRFKTGTPPRMHARNIHFEHLVKQGHDEDSSPFSEKYSNDRDYKMPAVIPCHLTNTTEETAAVILENIDRSPLYSGQIKGIGPRYCPSIEDKIVKFPNHKSHHIFLEPTGPDTQEIYASGLSTSMPFDVQKAVLKTVPGLEEAQMTRPGYAIEYDLVDPLELTPSLEHMSCQGLYCAGQINGSSGYEEAACQGLMAGINAAHKILGRDEFVLKRSEGYIGVLIDDLVTKGTNEPYRMMTSRAEYRLVLREDNADLRLTPHGRRIGLIGDARWNRFESRLKRIEQEIARLKSLSISAIPAVKQYLEKKGSSPIRNTAMAAELLRRPELHYADILQLDKIMKDSQLDKLQAEKELVKTDNSGKSENSTTSDELDKLPEADAFTAETEIKYEGYIKLEMRRIANFNKNEDSLIPKNFNYSKIKGLRIEAAQKLAKFKPLSIGMAARISGVSPADTAVLSIALKVYREQLKKERLKNEAKGQ